MKRVMPSHRPLLAFVSAGAVAALAACGAAPMQGPSGAKGAESAPAFAASVTVDEVVAELARAEAAVDVALGGGLRFAEAPGRAGARRDEKEDKALAQGTAKPAPASPAQPSAQAAPRAERGPADDRAGAAAELATQSPCATACRALASMERAVEHLCGLAGAGDARCESARTRARTAAERVRSGCPTCPTE